MEEKLKQRVEELEKKVAELEERVPAQLIKEIKPDYLSRLSQESLWTKAVRKEIIGVLKRNGASFGLAQEVLETTKLSLENTMLSRLITPKKVSVDLEKGDEDR
ncbi:hypothetical protein CACET_c15380 [Clostridium aceticum]|uniref:Uncharacterized protein n=1 Tax=Clostridium aceticum TaxID=84022 RepID=A0A0D8ICT9_9CLOT|nr:hypothetical protein [Clostridium aceticum]AKL94987.1 hypothetical protein CACET_c15380 [Clostridium aceticum]KJF27894.1 hypothetical protein TZ02_04760 [Clostridium aceticum]